MPGDRTIRILAIVLLCALFPMIPLAIILGILAHPLFFLLLLLLVLAVPAGLRLVRD